MGEEETLGFKEGFGLLNAKNATAKMSSIAPPVTAPTVSKFNSVFQLVAKDTGSVTVNEYEGEVETTVPLILHPSKT
jgi:hypothetical protein